MFVDPISMRFFRYAGLRSTRNGRGPVVVMYHGLHSKKGNNSSWSVLATNFIQQMKFLKNQGWQTLTMNDLKKSTSLAPRSIAITFDDGYQDNFDYGFITLQKYGLCATWFMVTRDIGQKSSWKDASHSPRSMLTKDQLLQMSHAGMEIGSHSRSHFDLTQMSDRTLQQEVEGSKKDLEQILGLDVSSFAYPYGLFEERTINTLKKAGYTSACTTQTGWVGSETDPFRIRRVAIFKHDTLSSFARKIAFADTEVKWKDIAGYMKKHLLSKLRVARR